MSRPRLLDLFCGAGGAGMGYHRAGFDVVGVDIKPQPRYPFAFHQADALTFPLDGFDAIHASPPCQKFSRARMVGTRKKNAPPDLIEPVRQRLVASGLPWVMENVAGAPLSGIVLCGSMFDLRVRRHRVFESNVAMLAPDCQHKKQGRPVGVYHKMGDQVQGRSSKTGEWVLGGRTAGTLAEGQQAMGIDWMLWPELRESIPPAYTEWIGSFVIRATQDEVCEECGDDASADGQVVCSDCLEARS